MKRVYALARRAARSDAKTLITGESGVGKDLVAQLIHQWSPRVARPYVPVNCAALTETLLESELFGYVKGSFTGACRDTLGKIQQADGGTLFLDEVGEMSPRMQALLLRFLENGEVQRVGEHRVCARVDVRIIAATNRNLADRVASGEFREDLLYRIRVIHIDVPPLRERPEDIKALIHHFARRASPAVVFSDEALEILSKYRWPGNVRELHNIVEQTIWLADHGYIEASDLPDAIRSAATPGVYARRERRRQVADQLFEALAQGQYTFWEHVHPLFLNRDLTRHDIRELVRRGLAETRGNYRALLTVFGMEPSDYHRFHNFLAAHECKVNFRDFRRAPTVDPSAAPADVPCDPLRSGGVKPRPSLMREGSERRTLHLNGGGVASHSWSSVQLASGNAPWVVVCEQVFSLRFWFWPLRHPHGSRLPAEASTESSGMRATRRGLVSASRSRASTARPSIRS